jgi:hypothetical protein
MMMIRDLTSKVTEGTAGIDGQSTLKNEDGSLNVGLVVGEYLPLDRYIPTIFFRQTVRRDLRI